MRKSLPLALALAAAAASAVETKTWTLSEAPEFEKFTLKGVALSSDGVLSLAPQFRELYDPSVSHLWCAVADAGGRLYAGGAGGRIFLFEAGKGRLFATVTGGDVHALALNARGELFAATAAEGKVWRVGADGAAKLFYDAKARYVWALQFDAQGALYVATGDPGQVHRVTPAGAGAVFFDAAEAHVRALAFDAQGNLIAGTEPGGLVLRVDGAGQAFVLYQTAKREVTALAAAADGSVYAAAAGNRAAQPAIPVPPPVTAPAPAPAAAGQPGAPQAAAVGVRVTAPPPTLGPTLTAVAGGSEIYRIAPDGYPRRIWTHQQHIVYALAFDAAGKLIAGTGNQGLIYRVESDTVATRLIDAEAGQVTALAAAGGRLFAATANVAKLFEIGPRLAASGTVESESFDAVYFTHWGRLRWEGEARGGSVKFETRSGNQERQQRGWSTWAAAEGRIASPAARFLAWRATLAPSAAGESPRVRLVEAAYQAKNVAPAVDRVEATPYNYKFSASALTVTPSASLSLGPIGQPRRTPPVVAAPDLSGSQTMSYDKGSAGARWRASDANGDTLRFKLEIRGAGEREWKLLKDNLRDARYSWDATGYADGEYVLRVTASDAPSNPPTEALSAQLESAAFTIDNTPPQILGLTARVESGKIRLRFKAKDELSNLQSADYAVNGGEWTPLLPTTRLTDAREHDYDVAFDKGAGAEFTIAVRVYDANDNESVAKAVVR